MLSIFSNSLINLGITVILIIWLCWLTFLTLKSQRFFHSLFAGSEKKNIQEALNKILAEAKVTHEEVKELEKQLVTLETKGTYHYQKVGLLRFNPFKDTGGEQSFILTLLDKHNNGIVISSLFSRTGNRWYLKKVENGKGVDVELSEEEKKVIEIAK